MCTPNMTTVTLKKTCFVKSLDNTMDAMNYELESNCLICNGIFDSFECQFVNPTGGNYEKNCDTPHHFRFKATKFGHFELTCSLISTV